MDQGFQYLIAFNPNSTDTYFRQEKLREPIEWSMVRPYMKRGSCFAHDCARGYGGREGIFRTQEGNNEHPYLLGPKVNAAPVKHAQ